MREQQEIESNLWEPLPESEKVTEVQSGPSRSFWQQGFRRILRDRLFLLAAGFLLLLGLLTLIVPRMWNYSYDEQNLNYASIPPVLALYQLEEDTYVYVTKEFNVIRTDGSGHLLEALRPVKKDVANRRNLFRIDEKQLVVDYSVKGTREDNGNKDVLYENQKIEPVKRVWNRTYYLGTDTLGRDLLIRVLYGARISLMVSILSAFLNLIVGVLYGSIAGYLGGRVDNVMMRFVDLLSSIPMTLYVILIMVALGQGIHSIVLAMGLVLWVRMARIVRGQVLHIRNRDYVAAARGLGVPLPVMIWRHFIPNMLGPVLVALSMQIPNAIFQEAFLSFIGLGITAPKASWGTLCNDALGSLYVHPYLMLVPALTLSVTILAFHSVSRGLKDAFTPQEA